MDWLLLAQETPEEADRVAVLLGLFTTPAGRASLSAVIFAVGLYLLIPPRGRGYQFVLGAGLSATALLLFLLPTLFRLPTAPVFFLLEGLALLGGLGTVTSRSPVYSAIWFASALLAIGALLLITGAQFLGLATVAVYAGAIVVTFLFVLMLAQPEGHAVYDRLSWGWLPTFCASLAGTSIAAVVACTLLATPTAGSDSPESTLRATAQQAIDETRSAITDDDSVPIEVQNVRLTKNAVGQPVMKVLAQVDSEILATGEAAMASTIRNAMPELDPSTQIVIQDHQARAENHVARLGGELYGRHLISIQVAALLLLVGLVAAIAMAIHGKDLAEGELRRGGVEYE